MSSLKQAVFLDRDGVINEAMMRAGKPYPPASVAELRIFSDTLSSLECLRHAGFLLIVVTNQPDVARGTTDAGTIDAINDLLQNQLPIDRIYVCAHDDSDGCVCRKPKPGLLLKAVDDYRIDLQSSFMVGDRWRDVEAGFAAGCRTIWIDRHYNEPPPHHTPDARVASLSDAVTWILNARGRSLECSSLN